MSLVLQPGFGGVFLIFRLFGLVFAGVALLVLVKPRAMTGRRIVTSDGEAATIEPTGAQLLLMRAMAALFVVVGLALALGVFP